jgi:exopolysaccharide production protein ExoZ
MAQVVSWDETRSATSGRSQLVSVQYLRAIAALSVLITHALLWPLTNKNEALLNTGRLGVEIFFVLSGFIITIVAGPGRFAPLAFARSRILRIVPIYWLATFLVVGLATAMPASFRTTVPTLEGLIKSMLFIPSDAPKAPLLLLGWTLNYEAFFYLVFGSLFFVKAVERTAAIAVLFILLIASGRLLESPTFQQEVYTSLSLLGFIFGTVIGLLHQSNILQRVSRRSLTGLIIAGLASLAIFYLGDAFVELRYSLIVYHVSMSIAAAAFVVTAIRLELDGRLPIIPTLRFLGDASYSLYIFHLFAVAAVWAMATKLLGPTGWLGYSLVAIVAIAAGLAAGLFSHWLLEQPLLSWMRRRRRVLSTQRTAS